MSSSGDKHTSSTCMRRSTDGMQTIPSTDSRHARAEPRASAQRGMRLMQRVANFEVKLVVGE